MSETEELPGLSELTKLMTKFEDLKRSRLIAEKQTNELPSIDINPFKMPGWAHLGLSDPISVNLGLRRAWLLYRRRGKKTLIPKRRFLVVKININRNGRIFTSLRHPLDLSNELTFSSDTQEESLQCLITFCQFIKPAMKRFIKTLRRESDTRIKEQEKYLLLVASVEKTFGSLVPFIMADELEK